MSGTYIEDASLGETIEVFDEWGRGHELTLERPVGDGDKRCTGCFYTNHSWSFIPVCDLKLCMAAKRTDKDDVIFCEKNEE